MWSVIFFSPSAPALPPTSSCHFVLLFPFPSPPSQVTSDGSGLGAAWHLDQVEVFDTTRAASTVFPCGEWLDPKDPMTLQQVCVGGRVQAGRGGWSTRHAISSCHTPSTPRVFALPHTLPSYLPPHTDPVAPGRDRREGRPAQVRDHHLH